MIRRRLPRSALAAIALSAVAGTIIAAAVIASAGSAQGSPETLRLVGTAQKQIAFGPTASRDKAIGSGAAPGSPAMTSGSAGRCAR